MYATHALPGVVLWAVLLTCHLRPSWARVLATELPPTVTEKPRLPRRRHDGVLGGVEDARFLRREVITEGLDCSYYHDDDPSSFSTGDYDCYIASDYDVWVYCPTTTTECKFYGMCEDSAHCTDGCGIDDDDLETTTCADSRYCSIDIISYASTGSWTWVHCGTTAGTFMYGIAASMAATMKTTTTAETTVESSATTAAETTSTKLSSGSSASETGAAATDLEAQTDAATTTSIELSQDSSSGGSSPNTGAIVGGVIGGLVLVCGTVIAAIYLLRRNNGRDDNNNDDDDNNNENINDSGNPQQAGGLRRGFSSWRFSRKAREPPELAGWGPRELPGSDVPGFPNKEYDRANAVELPG